jgi:membrane associated rhomboid family serine protease
MIPIRDVVPSRTTPFVTLGLIAINVAVYAYELSRGDEVNALVREYGLIPSRFSVPDLFTSMFLHGGLLHVGGNVLYLWIFGDNVEDRVGHGRFVIFYLLCGVAAALAQTYMLPASRVPMIGASGAVAGVMGAYFVLYPKSKVVTLVPLPFVFQLIEVPAILFLGIWFVMQFLSGVGSVASSAVRYAGGIAFWAHVGGFAVGVIGVLVLRRPERQRVEWWDGRRPS